MIRHLVAMLSAAALVLAMAPVASAGAGWYLMVPSDAQMMADGSVVKGVTVAQYPQAASFDTAAACESIRDARGSKALAASQLAERQLEAANAARYSYAPYDE